MILRRSLVLSLVCALGLHLVGCSQLRPLPSPSFQVATKDQSKIHEAIRQALLERKWSIIAQRSNGFDAEYQRTAEMRARVRVVHSRDTVSIEYLDSSDLGYTSDSGTPLIHRRYTTWVANLEKDIQVEIGRRL